MQTNKKIDFYSAISNRRRAEIKIKGSKFIATAAPANSAERAMELVESIRKEFYDATHNCFAYRIGAGGEEFRWSDDGEPSGSAGKPIFFTFEKFDVSDAVVVVTRYFGGTKLGVGGLVRAYSEAAEQALAKSGKKTVNIVDKVALACDYPFVSPIKRLIDEFAVSFKENYSDIAEFEIDVRKSNTKAFCDKAFSLANGKAKIEVIE